MIILGHFFYGSTPCLELFFLIFFHIIGTKAVIPNKTNATFICILKIVLIEKESLFSKMFSKPPPAIVKTKVPGKIPTNVVQKKVINETSKKAGAMLTSQNGNKGTTLKKSK